MECASEHLPSDKISFNRNKAKASAMNILNKVIPSKMNISECARVSNASRSNISRALKGESLLNANALCTIIKKAYLLKSSHEIKSLLTQNDVHLDAYLEKELGEEYLNGEFVPSEITTKLNAAISDTNAQMLYTILYTRKTLSTDTIIELFGSIQAEILLNSFIKNEIVVYHEKLKTIVINDNQFSTDTEFRKKQMKFIIDQIKNTEASMQTMQYQYDNILISKKYAKSINELTYKYRKDLRQLVTNAEAEDLSKRNIVMNYVTTVNQTCLKFKQEVAQ